MPDGSAYRDVEHNGFSTAFLDVGPREAVPILLLHGSGPGVSASANWQRLLAAPLADRRRLVAPDVVGFGGTRAPGRDLSHATRVEHLVDFLDSLASIRGRVADLSAW